MQRNSNESVLKSGFLFHYYYSQSVVVFLDLKYAIRAHPVQIVHLFFPRADPITPEVKRL